MACCPYLNTTDIYTAKFQTTGINSTMGLKPRLRLKFKALFFCQQNGRSMVFDLVDFTKQLNP